MSRVSDNDRAYSYQPYIRHLFVTTVSCTCILDFELVRGRYKTPMLRGDVSATVDSYGAFHKRLDKSVDNWLCNTYVPPFFLLHYPLFRVLPVFFRAYMGLLVPICTAATLR